MGLGESTTGSWRRFFVLVVLATTGCTELTAAEVEQLSAMELRASMLPESPSNAFADDPDAAALGRTLFFDEGFSSDETISCASCHDPNRGWSDDRAVSEGVFERKGARHSMPITVAAFQEFVLWDGRADSLWSQALLAIENPDEMDFTRTEVVQRLASEHREAYENVFGALPAIDGLDAQQDDIDEAFANMGKALEAFERTVSCVDTRFDRWVRGEVEMTRKEEVGAARFLRDGCARCHDGPRFSDGGFHNIGIGSGTDTPDLGRHEGISLLLDNPFNAAGPYSDDPDIGAAMLDGLQAHDADLGAFRTPTLRGVGQRRSFGHRGHIRHLKDFIEAIYDDPSLHGSAAGTLDPLVRDIEVERQARVVDFLRMLDCPSAPPELRDPDDE